MVIAIVDRDSHFSATTTPTIWGKPNKNGVNIGYTPTMLTSGPCAAMPYEVLANKGHTTDSESTLFVINYRDLTPFNRKSSLIFA